MQALNVRNGNASWGKAHSELDHEDTQFLLRNNECQHSIVPLWISVACVWIKDHLLLLLRDQPVCTYTLGTIEMSEVNSLFSPSLLEGYSEMISTYEM